MIGNSGKMSLVVLRSWSDGPPKVRAIAPPDDDRSVYVPDHHGRFVTEEAKEDPRIRAGEQPPPRCASSASQYKEVPQKDGPMSLMPESSYKRTPDGLVYRKTPLQRCFAIGNDAANGTNRHSYSGAGASAAGLVGQLEKAASLHLPLQEATSSGLDSQSSRPDSANSPDNPENPDASSLEYTPPSSPVNGRYRNLGPELAATIPKRTVRNNWIAEVKSRWNNKSSSSITATTSHPSSRVSSRLSGSSGGGKRGGSSSLKSYGSSPSLIYRNSSKSKGKTKKGKIGSKRASVGVAEEGEEEGDYFDQDEDDDEDDDEDENFILRGNNGETPHHHRRSSLQRIYLDEEVEEEEQQQQQQPFFNPLYKFSHNNKNSNPNTTSTTTTNSSNRDDSNSIVTRNRDSGNFSLLRSHLKSAEVGGTQSAHCLLHSRSALSVDDDSQSDRSRSSLGYPPSGNTSYSPSPPLTSSTPNEHIYSSLTDIRNEIQSNNGKGGRLDPFKLGDTSGTSDVVLVEVIRKQGKGTGSATEIKTGNKTSQFVDKYNKLEKFGSVDLIQKLGTSSNGGSSSVSKQKRHSIGEIEPDTVSPNKSPPSGKPETGSPGKVARFKESLKRFGRFGRSNTDKIVRTQSDSGFSTDDVHGFEFKDSVFGESKLVLEDQENFYESPTEIIVSSLETAEKLGIGITVKPAGPTRQPQPISESPLPLSENIYELPSNVILRSCSSTCSSSELTSPSPEEPFREHNEKLYVTVTDQKAELIKDDDDHHHDNLIKQDQSTEKEEKKTTSAKIIEDNDRNDRVSPPNLTKEAKVKAENEVDVEEDDDLARHIPHLEFDKGGDNSTSHDESCSSRAESLTYSSTSHEQDRSMPQQIVQLQNLLPKVDIANAGGGGISSDDAPNADISIDSGASSVDTLNCEVTPVIRKRSFDEELVIEVPVERRLMLVRQVSSSSVESGGDNDNNTNTDNLTVRDEQEQLKNHSNTNKDKDCQEKGKEEGKQGGGEEQRSSCNPSPVTLNEPQSVASDNNSDNMNSLSRTRCKISSREIFNNGQNDSKRNANGSSAGKNNACNGPAEGPEIIPSKVEENHVNSNEFNGMGKYENGTASVQVPVQAVNRHVVGYGISGANSVNSDNHSCNHLTSDEQQYNGSIASTTSKNDSSSSEWNKTSLRSSLRGFCEDMLQPDKMSIPVPDVVEAVINFDEDSSSIEQDEERENSIEYISVANVKVNREKRLDKLHPRDELPSCVIALDLGSRGSGYAYWIKEEPEFVRIGNVDGGSSCPASHKAPSWVMFDDLYLDGDEDGESSDSIRPGFGFQALDKYLTDDAHGQISWRWREHFHEGKSYPYTLDSKASDDDLIFMMKSTIRHYGRQAMEQISQRKKGVPSGQTVILIAIPSTFDRRARQLVRDAASEAGVLSESDSIALIEDSCATGLYSLHALKSKLLKETNTKVTEMSYLSVDCGAAYLHFSGYQLTEGKLRQLILSRSDPLIDSPESLFEAELSTVFTPNYIFNYQNKYKAGWLKLMTEFEHAKNRYDPLSKQNYYVFVPSSFVDHFRRFTNMEVEDALETSDMVWNKTGALGIPYWKMQRFLQPLLDYINDKIVTSMKKHKFDHVVLTGGRAGAKFYVDAIRTAAKGFGATLHVPKEYNAAVLQGSTISVTNLAPRLVIRSRFSIGVGVMTPFSEENHPEEKRVLRDGKSWCADVWDSLIRADQELELNRVIIKRSYVGAQPGQSLLVLPLFKSPDEPKFVTESSVQKCCELKFTSGQRAWQEVELVLVCRPGELLIKAMDGGVMKSYVVVDFSD